VSAGTVSVSGMTFTVDTDDPTVLVEGTGALKMRTCDVEESTGGFNQVAVYVTGGTVDLGVSGDLGGNTLDINDAGSLISNATATAISALGNNWQSNAVALPDNFAIE